MLGAFDTEHRCLNLSQMSRRSGLPLATVHRLAADLVEGRLLVRRGDGRYEIGARMWRLGLLAPPTDLRELAQPHMQDLVAATGHTVHLAVLDGASALVIERLAGTKTLPTRHSPGGHLPLHCTAVGKALLAYAPGSLVDEVMSDLRRYTAYTVTEPRVLHRQLDEIRRTVWRAARRSTGSVSPPSPIRSVVMTGLWRHSGCWRRSAPHACRAHFHICELPPRR